MYAYVSAERTPSPAAPMTAPRAPAGPSNQDQLARAGLGTPAPVVAPSADLADTLSLMGDLGTVVLDALPLPIALPLALERRALAWARAWLAEQSTEALSGVGVRAALDLVDAAFPTGTRVSIDGAISATFLAGMTPAQAVAVARTPGGWSIDVTRTLGVAKDVGVGGVVTGAFGAVLWGATAEAGVGGEMEATCGWDVPDGVVGTAILGVVDALRRAVCAQDATALQDVFHALAPSIARMNPSRTSVRTTAKAGAKAGGAGLWGAEAGVEASVSAACGTEGATTWWEGRLGGEAGARAISPLLEAAGVFVPQDLLAKADGRLGVRIERDGSEEDPRWTFTVLRASTAESGFGEAFEASDARSFLALLTSLVGVRASVRAPGSMPEVTLVSTASVPTPNVPSSVFSSPMVRTALDVADALPDQGFAASVREVRADATVRVGPEAVAVALEGTPRFSAVTEADVLDVGRAITAYVLGRSYTSASSRDANLAVGATCADVEAAWTARVATGVGAGVSGDLEALEAGAALRASTTIEGRAPITDRDEVARTFHA